MQKLKIFAYNIEQSLSTFNGKYGCTVFFPKKKKITF